MDVAKAEAETKVTTPFCNQGPERWHLTHGSDMKGRSRAGAPPKRTADEEAALGLSFVVGPWLLLPHVILDAKIAAIRLKNKVLESRHQVISLMGLFYSLRL